MRLEDYFNVRKNKEVKVGPNIAIIPIIPVFGRLWQDDYEFKPTLEYIAISDKSKPLYRKTLPHK